MISGADLDYESNLDDIDFEAIIEDLNLIKIEETYYAKRYTLLQASHKYRIPSDKLFNILNSLDIVNGYEICAREQDAIEYVIIETMTSHNTADIMIADTELAKKIIDTVNDNKS